MTYQEIINLAKKEGIEEIEIFVVSEESNSIGVMNGNLEKNSFKQQLGISIRGLYNNQMGYIYVESTDDATIRFAIKQLIENANKLTKTEKEFIYDGKGSYRSVPNKKADYSSYSTAEKVELLQKIEKDILAVDKRIVKVGYLEYMEKSSNTKIINSKGLNLERNFSYVVASAAAMATNGTDTTLGGYGDIGFEFKKLDTEKIVKEASSEALLALGGTTPASGKYETAIKYSAITSIFSAFSSVFSGESAVKKATILTDKAGKKFFGDNITIIDDPFTPKAISMIPFDDEGVPCYSKKVVDKGVFTGLLHNLATADYFKTTSTGNGFKANVSSNVGVNCTNMYLEPGELSFDELISTIKDGVYITEVTGLHAGLNPISGDFNVQSKGFYIKNGKIDKPITLFVLSGNFYEMLNNVTGIANDLEENFIGISAPTIKISSMNISGK